MKEEREMEEIKIKDLLKTKKQRENYKKFFNKMIELSK